AALGTEHYVFERSVFVEGERLADDRAAGPGNDRIGVLEQDLLGVVWNHIDRRADHEIHFTGFQLLLHARARLMELERDAGRGVMHLRQQLAQKHFDDVVRGGYDEMPLALLRVEYRLGGDHRVDAQNDVVDGFREGLGERGQLHLPADLDD